MQKLWLVALLLASVLSAHAQEEVPLDSLLQSAEQWAKANLDDDTLAVLQNIDQEKVRQSRLRISAFGLRIWERGQSRSH